MRKSKLYSPQLAVDSALSSSKSIEAKLLSKGSSSAGLGIFVGMADATIVTLISESRIGSTNALSNRERRINATLFRSLRMAFSLLSIFIAILTSPCRSALPSESRTISASLMRSKLEICGYLVVANPLAFICKNFAAF